MDIFQLLRHWEWFRDDNPDGTVEQFMDYLVKEDRAGGGL